MKLRILVGAWLLAAGCARTPDAIRAREADRARRAHCYTVELYQFGVTPPRRFRVVGPVAVDGDGIPAHSDRALQEQACAIGADAVVDIRETQLLAQPSYAGVDGVGRSMSVSGTAVAYVVDEPPPTPPPAP